MRARLQRNVERRLLAPFSGRWAVWFGQMVALNIAILLYASMRLFTGFSEAMAEKLLGHGWGKTSFTMPAEMYLALLTSVPTASSTGESIEASEATYTGYVRLKLDLTKFKLTKAATCVIENELELTFATCTGLEKTLAAWATTEKKRGEACNICMYGTTNTVTINSEKQPPTIAAKTLKGELK